MGLDAVEIVMGWEAAFGITIANEEAFRLRNTRMAVDLIAAKVGARVGVAGSCLSLRAFNRLRGAVGAGGTPRSCVRPDTKVRRLINSHASPGMKEIIRGQLGIEKLPLAGGWTGILFAPQTFGDLANWIVCHAPTALFKPGETWSRSQVRQVVRAVVMEQIVVPDDYSDDADFVNELGVD